MRILVTHSSCTGHGHRMAAEALVNALREHPGVEAESFDMLSVCPPEVRETQKKNVQAFESREKLARWSYELALAGNPVIGTVQWAINHYKAWMVPQALQYIKDYQPDLIVSTHEQASGVVDVWKDSGQLTAPLVNVHTDHLADMRWVQPQVQHYFVANEMMREDLGRLGVEPDKVSVTGIPIRPEFGQPAPADLDQKLGLDPALPTVLIMGGGLGQQPFHRQVEALERQRYPMQIICVCGTNQAAYDELKARQGGNHPLHVLGSVKNMPELLKAADVVVSKAGGLTTSEILAAGKPMILYNPRLGLSVHQSNRLESIGVASIARSGDEMAGQVVGYLSDERRKNQVAEAMLGASKPDSSRVIAAELVKMVSRQAG